MANSPSALRHPILSYQPLSIIYKLIRITNILLRLPFWLIKALIPGLRPHATWTFQQTLTRNFVYHSVHINSTVGVTETLSLKPRKEGARWKTIEPFADELYIGPLVDSSGRVKPAVTGGTWYGLPSAPTKEAAVELTKVVMHIHGGAFVTFDGREGTSAYMAKVLTQHAGFDAVFMPQYRLAGYGGRDPFPAGLQDCLTSYLYLVRTLGIAPERVTVSGDSAGGNLALALLRYLERFGAQAGGVPAPGHVVLLSPWVRPSAALRTDYDAWDLARTDYLPASFLRWGADAYVVQAADVGEGSEWVDPLGHPFRTGVPVFVSFADREILSVDCAAWAEEWRKENDGANGGKFVVNVEPNAPHDTLLVGGVGWDANAEDVAAKIGNFVSEN